jgi:tripartite-type tricarboxylate transporter receptor subunit TctC
MLGARRLTRAFMLAAMLLPLFAAAPLPAQTWPTRPVKFILTLGPGSGADIGARLLADRLTRKWDQPIVVENRPGGDGIVAINTFVSAQDDHVLLFAPSSSFIGHPYQHNDLPYKPDDLAPIARVSNTVVAISVPADLPVKTLGDVVELARSKPGQLNWAGLAQASVACRRLAPLGRVLINAALAGRPLLGRTGHDRMAEMTWMTLVV